MTGRLHDPIVAELAALRRVATLVAQGAPPGQVFAAVTAETGPLLARLYGSGAIRPAGPDHHGGRMDRHRAGPAASGGQLDAAGGQNVSTLVCRTGRPARVTYDNASGAIGRSAVRDWGMRSSVGVPISIEGRL
jgi:hypothetical protein